MEYRQLGRSSLQVPVLSFGTGTFGGTGPLFGAWGSTDATEARRLVDICLEAGVNLFDTANSYSGGAAERILGEAIRGRRGQVLIATKVGLPVDGDQGSGGMSHDRLEQAVEASLHRMGTDYIDLLQLHALDASVPPDALLKTLEALTQSGKVRHVGVSNYPAWQLMKALAIADSKGLPRFVSHQVYYSLVGRDYEAELLPLGADQQISALVWSPLAWGRLTGKLRRGEVPSKSSRLGLQESDFGPHVDDELLFCVIDVLENLMRETGKTMPQIALNWLTRRPTIASVIFGARNEKQLIENIGSVGWSLTDEQMQRLDSASAIVRPYPQAMYLHPGPFRILNPPLV